ncbi:Mrp/NBP35 family ATP-binding protein [Akkermansiaceae bacterium]|nr:Mrp/NBP35 family ATP-binding protein [Akkermansiaceae bacterium]MDA7935952.1 Mrp/NBP35 family ATP-binding protein [bacterium]MDA7863637.1 Mrp/NBP35 family ATP-binding protein [Akkermansiaceae bacterium]MDA7876777.1 Mrp/NBP35 family ATP-binding protein [Akkermansiaceae bacterium]MDA8876484.1 Mrp/NBP35 family ATP-binding protein [Akkermansiaceae bacterium]
MTNDELRAALATVSYPGFSRDIVSFGLVKSSEVLDGTAQVKLQIQTRDAVIPKTIFEDCHKALDPLFGGPERVRIEIDVQDPPSAQGGENTGSQKLPGVKRIIAIGSGKGGVGKSTVSSNIAIALSAQGLKVGLLDCDLYGPSVPLMLGVQNHQPQANEHDQIIPIEAHGLKLMSMGFLLSDQSPVIVRGPMATRYTQQFLQQVAWGELDVLILDLPPGTGDIQLTLVQTVALDGAVIVTTPQEVALIDARKAVSMFAKVNVPILGLIENMSYFECDHGERYHLFGQGGAQKECDRLKVPLLGQIPLEPVIGQRCDGGEPIAILSPSESKSSAAFHDAADALLRHVTGK